MRRLPRLRPLSDAPQRPVTPDRLRARGAAPSRAPRGVRRGRSAARTAQRPVIRGYRRQGVPARSLPLRPRREPGVHGERKATFTSSSAAGFPARDRGRPCAPSAVDVLALATPPTWKSTRGCVRREAGLPRTRTGGRRGRRRRRRARPSHRRQPGHDLRRRRRAHHHRPRPGPGQRSSGRHARPFGAARVTCALAAARPLRGRCASAVSGPRSDGSRMSRRSADLLDAVEQVEAGEEPGTLRNYTGEGTELPRLRHGRGRRIYVPS